MNCYSQKLFTQTHTNHEEVCGAYNRNKIDCGIAENWLWFGKKKRWKVWVFGRQWEAPEPLLIVECCQVALPLSSVQAKHPEQVSLSVTAGLVPPFLSLFSLMQFQFSKQTHRVLSSGSSVPLKMTGVSWTTAGWSTGRIMGQGRTQSHHKSKPNFLPSCHNDYKNVGMESWNPSAKKVEMEVCCNSLWQIVIVLFKKATCSSTMTCRWCIYIEEQVEGV